MGEIISVNPFRCRIWDLHDRFEGEINEETCRAEIESVALHGQFVPALGRPLRGQPDYDVELICGARRLFVARHIGHELAVELREMSDKEALIAMDAENRQRCDISPYERGMSYAQWLRRGFFASQDDIARTLGISAAQVSRLLKLARLPAVIVNAFRSPVEIHESWGRQLTEALDDPRRRQLTIQKARWLSCQNPRAPGREVYSQLLASSASGRIPKLSTRDEVVKNERGRPIFRIRHLRGHVALLLPIDLIPMNAIASIQEKVAEMLQSVS